MINIFLIIIAFSLMLTILFLSHYYIYNRVLKVFDINKLLLALTLGILTISFILISIIERYMCNSLTKFFYFVSSSWLGVLFFLLIGVLLIDLIFFIFKLFEINLDYKALGISMMIIILIITAYSLYNAKQVRVTQISIEAADIKDNLKIIQISDLHIGALNNKEYLEKVVRLSNSLNPDLVLITGDLLDGSGRITNAELEMLKLLKTKEGVYFVTGNHETYFNQNEMLELIKSQNITILRNEKVDVAGIQLIGIDYPNNEFSKNNEVLKNISLETDKFSILMYHSPTGLQDAVDKGIRLQLSGHAHNGQIFPIQLIEKLIYKYVSGLHHIKNTYFYISQGAGTWGPPMRFGSYSEIVEINLIKG
jgi:uncharacterized protein